ENKFIGYEKTPYITDPTWFRKGLVCSNDAYLSQKTTKRFTAQEMLLNGNFTSVDSMYDGYPCPGNSNDIVSMINAGLGFLNYRGEGWYSGWSTSCFPLDVSDINSLSNGQKLTFVTSIGCGVANFDNGSYNNFGEAWMEIGEVSAPRGGCAFLGPVSNTHTNYNNEIDKGIYIGMFEEELDTPGEAMLRGKFRMYQIYGGSDFYVGYHYRIYHVLGDPSLHIWKDTPKNINVFYNDSICVGPAQVNVTVSYQGSGLPVAGAKVCVSSDSIYTIGFTSDDGTAVLYLNPQSTGALNFTVSGSNVIPFEGTVQVTPGGAFFGWQWIETGFPYKIYDISFPPGQSETGYAVGSNTSISGIILKTVDGGSTWSKISNDSIPGLRSVCFTSIETGYAGGYQNYLMKTTDGGVTWTMASLDSRSSYISSIKFWDSDHGIFVNSPSIVFVTTNAGNTWMPAQGVKQTVEDICYADANTLYLVGMDEMISRSTTGGFTWDHIYSGTPFFKLTGVDFYNQNYGIAGGENGKMLVTTDGGVTWTTSNAGTGLMYGVNILDEENAFAAGSPEQVFKSTDGGITWISDFNGANTVEFYKLRFTENRTGLICGSDGKFLINRDYAVPVELTAFTASVDGNNIRLNWTTATETNNAGFDVLRSADGSSWDKIAFVQGAGTKTTTTNYSFQDQRLKPGSYFYKLKQTDYDGSYSYSDMVNAIIMAPAKFVLEQNYPNPFNPVTTIRFTIPKEVMVNLSVYNVVGEKVKELKNEVTKPGYYEVDFDASNIASGVYFYRLQAGDFISTRKMNLLK
ncbi:MAG TPA: C25 family cysteine peptidase, partial [Ignavibacteriaceae bacterium]